MSAAPTDLRDAWAARWPEAMALWSDYVRLSEPIWCLDRAAAQRESLSASFAMIRLDDHAVVLNLEEIAERGLDDFALEVMGHEIGHHILCPADLADHARLLLRTRKGLPGREERAPQIANLYADLLINDHLQREYGLRFAELYARLDGGGGLWRLYLRIYELLWRLKPGQLTKENLPDDQEGDARLGARLVRVYARDWLRGAAGFAALCRPYLEQAADAGGHALAGWGDTTDSPGGEIPEGLSEQEAGEAEPALHPAEDPAVNGDNERAVAAGNKPVAPQQSGRKSDRRYRDMGEYGELLRALNVRMSAKEAAIRYYRERARPYLIRFPEKILPQVADPMPEGLETWDWGRPTEEVDWVESVVRSPVAIPGVTTVTRVWGETPGQSRQRQAIDLYVGIDCSGSMPAPVQTTSFAVLAGFIVTLSALRAGVRVMACLSGEPGRSVATDGFTRDESILLSLLTDYLGTGYSYGIQRLREVKPKLLPGRRCHLLILTDTDIFSSLRERDGWQVAEQAARDAAGGATLLLATEPRYLSSFAEDCRRLESSGWRVAQVPDWAGVVGFARDFARRNYGGEG